MNLFYLYLLIYISGNVVSERRQVEIQVNKINNGNLFPKYNMHVTSEKVNFKLRLKPSRYLLLTPNFKLAVAETDPNGKLIFKDSRDDYNSFEKNILVDTNSNAAIRLTRDRKAYQINGIIGNQKLSFEDGKHFLQMLSVDDLKMQKAFLYIASKRQSSKTVTPELAVVLDYDNYKTFKANQSEIIHYLSLFFHSVNNRYSNILHPKILFRVTGLTVISTPEAQPFITKSIISKENKTYDVHKILDHFSSWAYNNSASTASHDLITLLSGVHIQSKNSNGTYVDGVSGLSYLRSACLIDSKLKKDFSSSVVRDADGFFAGVTSAAHEIAHSLGAPHDGLNNTNSDYSTLSCPAKRGYIMSYKGYGSKNKFYFSQCSKAQIRKFISSEAGSCIRRQEATSYWALPEENPGDFMNMTVQCQKSLNKTNAYVDHTKSPDQLCRNLSCMYPDAKNKTLAWSLKLNRMSADSSPCGTNGVCKNWKKLNDKEQLNIIC